MVKNQIMQIGCMAIKAHSRIVTLSRKKFPHLSYRMMLLYLILSCTAFCLWLSVLACSHLTR